MRALVLLALLGACDDATIGDAPDAAAPDADPQPPRCGPGWHLGVAPSDAIALHDPAPITAGRSYRIAITHIVPACGLGSAIQLSSDDGGNRFADVQVWDYDGPCDIPPLAQSRVLAVETEEEGTDRWRWGQHAGGIPGSLDVAIGAAAASDCDHTRTPCRVDCDCELGEVCLGYEGAGGPTTACGRPCDVDLDCDGAVCGTTTDGLDHVCLPESIQCDPDRPCPRGSTCEAGDCVPGFEVLDDPPACGCDADCADGLRCVEYGLPPMRCYATCTSDAQCPPSAPCTGGLCGGGRG